MKNNLFYLFTLMAIAAMPLTSCEKEEDVQKEEDAQHDPKSDSDQTKIATYDALSWLQGSIVVVDDNDKIIRRIYGKPLDESQPDVISVPVAGYGAAEKIFLSWVAPGKEAVKVDGGYDYNLTDADGKGQGNVAFRVVEDEDGVKAHMTVAEGTGLKMISEVRFIDYDLWPENDAYERVEAGKVYQMEDYELKWEHIGSFDNPEFNYKDPKLTKLPFYCIQGNTDGKEGILVWLSPDVNDSGAHPRPYYYIRDKAYNYLPTVPEAQAVLNFFNSNLGFWNKMVKEMDENDYVWSWRYGGWTTGNDEFLLSDYDSEKGVIKCLDLDQDDGDDELGNIGDVDEDTRYKYRYMHIKIIPPLAE